MLLEGLKVVELGTWIAAPGCAAMMADWGAEVIKVEGPEGDPTRTFFPDTPESPGNPVFSMANRGKKGIVLNLQDPADRQALLRLLQQADVFVTNVRPGALKRMSLDYDSVKGLAPRLIYASVSGYGLRGDEVDKPAFDITAFWTRTGVARAMIPSDQDPFTSRPGFGDHSTALATLAGILAAVHERASTGRGRLVETSLVRTGAYVIGWDLSVQLRYGEVTTALSRDDGLNPITGYFRTADDRWICVVPRSDECFTRMMIAIDQPQILADERYAYPIADIERAREIRKLVDDAFADLTFAEMSERLITHDLIWGALSTLSDFAQSEIADSAGCFEIVGDGRGRSFKSPAAPARFPEGAPAIGQPAPRLGQHTQAIMDDLNRTKIEAEG